MIFAKAPSRPLSVVIQPRVHKKKKQTGLLKGKGEEASGSRLKSVPQLYPLWLPLKLIGGVLLPLHRYLSLVASRAAPHHLRHFSNLVHVCLYIASILLHFPHFSHSATPQ